MLPSATAPQQLSVASFPHRRVALELCCSGWNFPGCEQQVMRTAPGAVDIAAAGRVSTKLNMVMRLGMNPPRPSGSSRWSADAARYRRILSSQ